MPNTKHLGKFKPFMRNLLKLINALSNCPRTADGLKKEGIDNALEIAKEYPNLFTVSFLVSTPIISLRFMNEKSQRIQCGKGSRPRPVKGNVYRERFDKIFGKKKKSIEKKKEKTLCPHCATLNLIQESPWIEKCLKCGWSR